MWMADARRGPVLAVAPLMPKSVHAEWLQLGATKWEGVADKRFFIRIPSGCPTIAMVFALTMHVLSYWVLDLVAVYVDVHVVHNVPAVRRISRPRRVQSLHGRLVLPWPAALGFVWNSAIMSMRCIVTPIWPVPCPYNIAIFIVFGDSWLYWTVGGHLPCGGWGWGRCCLGHLLAPSMSRSYGFLLRPFICHLKITCIQPCTFFSGCLWINIQTTNSIP